MTSSHQAGIPLYGAGESLESLRLPKAQEPQPAFRVDYGPLTYRGAGNPERVASVARADAMSSDFYGYPVPLDLIVIVPVGSSEYSDGKVCFEGVNKIRQSTDDHEPAMVPRRPIPGQGWLIGQYGACTGRNTAPAWTVNPELLAAQE